MSKQKPVGLLCEAYYIGSKFKRWEGNDKQSKTPRKKWFCTLTHRFEWETENGSEQINTTEWLDGEAENAPLKLSDCEMKLEKGEVYRLKLRGLKEEGGILVAECREFDHIADAVQ